MRRALKFTIGMEVSSKAVGAKKAFKGRIVNSVQAGFIVLDPSDDTTWIRNSKEISPVISSPMVAVK